MYHKVEICEFAACYKFSFSSDVEVRLLTNRKRYEKATKPVLYLMCLHIAAVNLRWSYKASGGNV